MPRADMKPKKPKLVLLRNRRPKKPRDAKPHEIDGGNNTNIVFPA